MRKQVKKNMPKGRYVRLCAAALACAVLAGCSGKELPTQGQKDEAGSQKEGNAGQRNLGPKVAKVSHPNWLDQVMYAEGCYCIFDGRHYGFLTEEGEEITPCIYERAAPFSEGLACVCLDGKYGFIGRDGETKLPFCYDQASPFTEGLAYFRIGEDYGFMDHEGRVILRPDCDSVSSFREGRAYFSVDGLYGYLDDTGRVVAEPVYEDAGYFQDGLAKVMQNGCCGLIGLEGEVILPPAYDDVETEDGFILAEREGLKYCFDGDGRQCLKEGWDSIRVRDGVFLVSRDGRDGLVGRDGKVLFEPEYESLRPIPEKELVIARKNGFYGVMDYSGKEKLPFVYSAILYDDSGAGGLRVTYGETSQEGLESLKQKNGFLFFDGGHLTFEIPAVYDSLSFFEGERAVAGINGKYGILRRDGSLEYPMEYDSIHLYENGAAALWTGNVARLVDRNGNVILAGTYDVISLCGKCYEVKKGGKYGLLDEQGEQVVPVSYDDSRCGTVCGAEDVLNMVQYDQGTYLLVKTDEGAGTGIPELFLQNHVTPRRKEYMDFLQTAEREGSVILSELNQAYRSFGKLYRIGEEVILYHRSEPYEQSSFFPVSDSGFYVFRDGKVKELAAGGECGGSMQGDFVCFWYDRAESRMKLGVAGNWGGFGGYAVTGAVLELQGAEAKVTAAWERVRQVRANYDQEELLRNAASFYDDEDRPYTRETILEAEFVTEYQVNGERISPERFAEVQDRYRYVNALDLYP